MESITLWGQTADYLYRSYKEKLNVYDDIALDAIAGR